ncbi:Tetratricopeptide repeat-containing domain [Plasmopara halstedii]|uniref:Tetratricopeptide repeat-containing domain n=1 Tax=Plasmopara halstedii TaxID=4781 RepID=A0A0P1A850_PLAHL|nr:Tetratricopeptide repeat-containing domain [Plasmopara halstedii]CEG36361.1 Tetratricopeptide repeat-containing domain [Plasmopara halstedii]|eukprot:XP_024572730.1 Tetratricopeptide repeat-containing domain [Plasmopara halstedii]
MALEAQQLRCQQCLQEGTGLALEEAAITARSCLNIDETLVYGYLMLTEALSRLRRHDEAVTWYKKGLRLHPDNADLQLGLKEARVAVLNALLEESDEEEDVKGKLLTTEMCAQTIPNKGSYEHSHKIESISECSTLHSTQIVQQTQSYTTADDNKGLVPDNMGTEILESGDEKVLSRRFQAKVERILEHLDAQKLARMTIMSIFAELISLRSVTFGTGLLVLGLLAQAIIHRQILMVLSMLIICIYHSQLKISARHYAQNWVQTSEDKLCALKWLPQFCYLIPILMRAFGQLKFMLCLQQDLRLAGVVLVVTAMLVANSLRTNAGQQAKLWGEGRRIKFAAYFTTIAYWVVWRGQWADSLRLFGPAFIDAGGIVLGCISSDDLHEIYRCTFVKLYNDVANGIQSDVDLDTWFFLGLSGWLIEYWQQPTDFSMEMLSKMLAECFDAMEKAAVRTFRPELRQLRNQVNNMEISDELHLLVVYFKQSLEAVPPARYFGMTTLFIKSCPSFVIFGFLVIFYGVISLPSLPFVVSEFKNAKINYDRFSTGKLQKLDGFELMLLDSPLLHVWKNLKNCIYYLEGSVTFSKALTTGTHVISAAARISQLAAFASRVRNKGIFANAHDIPDHIANLFLVVKDSSLIFDGVRHLRGSSHIQDLQASICNWWSGGTT